MLIYEKPWNVVLCLSAINHSILPKKFYGFLLLFFLNYFRVCCFFNLFLFLYLSQYKTFAVFHICFAISLVAFI